MLSIGSVQLLFSIKHSNISYHLYNQNIISKMMHLWKLPHYEEVSILAVRRCFHVLLLPMLKNIIQDRLSSKGDVDLMLKENYHDDIKNFYDSYYDDMLLSTQHRFSLDSCKPRLVLKMVSKNKIGCFSPRETELCLQLGKYEYSFDVEWNFSVELSFVLQVLVLTRVLLKEIGKRNNVEQYLAMLGNIEHFLRSNL